MPNPDTRPTVTIRMVVKAVNLVAVEDEEPKFVLRLEGDNCREVATLLRMREKPCSVTVRFDQMLLPMTADSEEPGAGDPARAAFAQRSGT